MGGFICLLLFRGQASPEITRAELDEYFAEMDADHDDRVSQEELLRGLDDLGIEIRGSACGDSGLSLEEEQAYVSDIFPQADTDGNGFLSKRELVTILDKVRARSNQEL